MNRAIFPGSFDPITLGHQDIVNRVEGLFDELVIAIGTNSDKHYMFDIDQRIRFLHQTFSQKKHITIKQYQGLTIDFAQEIEANYIVRGLRNPADFEFEKAIAQTNRKLSGIETVFLLTSADCAFISSSIVREIYRHNGDVSQFVPQAIKHLF